MAAEQRAAARRKWLRSNVGYALKSHEFMLSTLAEIAVDAYGLVSPALQDQRVPDDLLRADVKRYPPTSSKRDDSRSGLIAFLNEFTRMTATGPLATAVEQVFDLHGALIHSRLAARPATAAEHFPRPILRHRFRRWMQRTGSIAAEL